MRLAYWDEGAYVTQLKVTGDKADVKKEGASKPSKTSKDSEKVKKRKAESSAAPAIKKMAVPSHLQFWSDRHAELHGIQRNQEENPSPGGENLSPNTTTTGNNNANSSASPPPSQSFADPVRNCCYLCMRQFKTSAEVNRHERLSQLHRDNLQNEELKAKAMAKLAKKREDQPHLTQDSTTEYRDRARERRKVFGPSTKPKEKKIEKEEEPVAAPAMSKGASLLGKMGWSAGTGLGAQGTGMTAPVTTELYAQGVGLGAQGSKIGDAVQEAGRNTRGRYDEFLEKTRDLARERYEMMKDSKH